MNRIAIVAAAVVFTFWTWALQAANYVALAFFDAYVHEGFHRAFTSAWGNNALFLWPLAVVFAGAVAVGIYGVVVSTKENQ